MITRVDLNRIKGRWTTEKKISGKDVAALLDAADRAITMASAQNLNDASRSPHDRLTDALFGRGFK